MNDTHTKLEPYVPRVASEWDTVAPGQLWRPIEGSLVFVDISGFTALSERLAQKGRIGAEELTGVLNRVFGQMLDVVYQRGGSLLKFGGDALLLFFSTHDHVLQACAATVEMRSALRSASLERTSVGRIDLKMSSGIHTGAVDFFLVGDSHRELIVTGPAASVTTEMERSAEASEIVVSDAVRRELPSDFIGRAKGSGWLMRKRKIGHAACGLQYREPVDPETLTGLVPSRLRTQLELGLEDSEHRIATIAFVKFKGVDSLISNRGPEGAAKHIDQVVTAVQNAADHEEIAFLASDIDADGGKLILAGGVPSGLHDDEGRVLRAAGRIVSADLDLEVKIGVNRGHVYSGNVGTEFRRTYTVMGDTVNLAARLMAAAGSGAVFSTPPVLNLSSTLFRTEPLEPFYVKGKEQPVQAFSVFEETGARPPEIESELPFRGRDAELEMIVGIVNTCTRVGRGGMMTIKGDVGIGKSRLIAEVVERCSGMDILMLQAEPSGIDNPYWAFRDPMRRQLGIERLPQAEMAESLESAVARMNPDLAWAIPLLGDVLHIGIEDNEITADIDPKFRPDRTADALIDLLSARHRRPVALIAEDRQWLDEASVALLSRVGEAATEHPWTVLVTARSDGDFEPMGDEIVLYPLDDAAIRSIAAEVTQATPLRPHELDAVVEKAGGNPLFLSEILRVITETGTADELPDSLDAVISTEIDTLPPLPRRLLRYSSVLGRRFRRVVLNEFLEPENIEIDDATVRELGRFLEDEGEGRLAFRHNLVHDIAYAGLSYSKRRELHARAGDVIERRAGASPESVAEYLSNHYSQSGEYEKAWRYARVAGDKARGAYANAEAAAQYRRALDAARWIDTSAEERAGVQELLGSVLDRLGDFDEAITCYQRAQHAYDAPTQRARVLSMQADMLHKKGEHSRALGTLTRGLRVADSDGAEEIAAEMLAQKASIRNEQGKYRDAIALAGEALSRASDGPSEARMIAEMTSDLAETSLGVATDHAGAWRAVRIAEELGNTHSTAGILNNMGMFAYFEGEWDEAVDFYARSSEAFRKTGDEIAAAYGHANEGEILSDQGHLEDAESVFSQVLPVFRAAGDLRGVGFILTHLGRILVQRGETRAALQHFDEALEIYRSMRAGAEQVDVGLRRTEALVIAERPEEARKALEEQRLAPEAAPTQLKSLAHRIHGFVALAGGDHDAGLEHLQSSLSAAEQSGSEVDVIAAIHALAAAGTADRQLVDRAAELCEKLGVISVPLFRVNG